MSSDCGPPNGFYRDGKELRPTQEQIAETRDALIKLFEFVRSDPEAPDPPELVWRGMGGQAARIIKRLKPGEIWKNYGYTSTSLSPPVADRYAGVDGIVMEIKPNPNRKGVDFSAIAGNYDDQEYLMDKGSKFRFVAAPEVPFQRGHGRSARIRPVTVYQFEEL